MQVASRSLAVDSPRDLSLGSPPGSARLPPRQCARRNNARTHCTERTLHCGHCRDAPSLAATGLEKLIVHGSDLPLVCHTRMDAARRRHATGTAQARRWPGASTAAARQWRWCGRCLFSTHMSPLEGQRPTAPASASVAVAFKHQRVSSRIQTSKYSGTLLSDHSAANAALRTCVGIFLVHRSQVKIVVHAGHTESGLSHTLLVRFLKVPAESLAHRHPSTLPGISFELPKRKTADGGRRRKARWWLGHCTGNMCRG